MKRKSELLKIIVAGLTAGSLLINLAPAMAEPMGFKDVPDHHWANSGILNAVKQGIVSGYPDGLFHPETNVSRSEFIKMTVAALKLPVEAQQPSQHWSKPYFEAARIAGIYAEGDFATTDLTQPMTRREMVHVAVRAIGETGKDDYEFLYKAAKFGLISGTGEGNLDPDRTTTRAQAVVVIQRIQQVRDGVALPVDEAAVSKAEKVMNAEKDPWGRPIRTTNLPKNFKDYPYILEDLPNEMYEMVHENYIDDPMSAAEFSNHSELTKEIIDNWVDLTNDYGNVALNVDYKTIDSNWIKDYLAPQLIQSDASQKDAIKYVIWARKNYIQIEGNLKAEPSMLFIRNGDIIVRCQIKFRINSFDKNEKLFDDLWFPDNKYKKNTWYEGYTDISLVSNVFNGRFSYKKVYPSIFRTSIVHEVQQ